MRASVFMLTALFLVSCGRAEREREAAVAAAVEATRIATLMEVGAALTEALEETERVAGAAERVLSPLPVMTPGDEDALRRFLNGVHVARAQQLGVRVGSRAELDSLVSAGRLIALPDSTSFWIVRPGTSPAHVVPHVRDLLEEVGRRFHQALADMDLPPYRFEITSATRTSERQARLRRSNANAAAGLSSHEFGTTLDISYAAFAPPAEQPPEILASVPSEVVPHVSRMVDLALESVSARKSRELGRIFGQVLQEAQREGLAVVIYERQQTVYHVTVAAALAD